MKQSAVHLILALLPVLVLVPSAQAQEPKPPEFVGVKVGIADRYKVGVWTPIEVTLRGGTSPVTRRVRATVADSDGLNCSFDAQEPRQVLPGRETNVTLYVRFGHEASALGLELLDPGAPGRSLASKTFDSSRDDSQDQFPDALRSEQRLIVSVGKGSANLDKALPDSQGSSARNVVAAVDSLARLPTRWEGYEGVDFVIISTSKAEVFENIGPENPRIEALDQWVRMGGTLVLCAGSNAESALHAGSPLAKFAPGRFLKTEYLPASVWETYARSPNRISKAGENVKLPTPRLADPQGKIEAREDDLPLVIRKAQGLGQVVFVATDLDRGPIRDWSDRWRLVAALLNLPANVQADDTAVPAQSYGYNDLAGQLRSALDQFREVRLVPFFVVALLVIVYILLIGPGDYFLLRRLGRGIAAKSQFHRRGVGGEPETPPPGSPRWSDDSQSMHWTWITFPAIVLVFSVGAYEAAYWLKGNQLRVNQIDVVDVDSEGVARGASWFSIFSPRGESFDLSMRPRLPNGQAPQQASVSLGWFGKAGEEFNGMHRRDTQGSPLWGRGYSITPTLETIHDVPIQDWASKSFVQRWLGHAPNVGLEASLKDDQGKLSGTIVNRLAGSDPTVKNGIVLSHCYLVYENWAYVLDTLSPGKSFEIGPLTTKISLDTFLSGETTDFSERSGGTSERAPYDRGNRDMAYVLRRMMFYDAAGGLKRTGMANDYQAFIDLSSLLKTGRAVLVGMPPQDGSCRGGDLLRGPLPQAGEADSRQPLGSALDRHTTFYRFVLPVTAAQSGSAN